MWGTENWILVSIGFFAMFVAIVMYMLGGTQGFGLWWRRFLGSFVLASATNGIALFENAWHWQYILVYPALIFGFSLPYGGDSTIVKVVKRTVFALGCCTAGIAGLWATGFTGAGIGIIVMQVVVGLWSVYLGVVNPYKNAPLEQGIICLLLTFTVPFWAYVQ